MKGICISLFHGRNSPNEELQDWGFDGAVIMNVGFAWTYGSLKIFEVRHDGSFGDMVILPQVDGMVALNSKYYGDFEICLPTDPIATNPDREKLTFLQLKELIDGIIVERDAAMLVAIVESGGNTYHRGEYKDGYYTVSISHKVHTDGNECPTDLKWFVKDGRTIQII